VVVIVAGRPVPTAAAALPRHARPVPHQLALPADAVVDHARAPCPHPTAMIGIADPVRADTDLAAGTLRCPGCAGPLQPWGHARTRTVRDRCTATVVLRPRRARCPACRATHVLLPAVVAPRRADTTAGIGAALQASAAGAGYRRIAAQLDRPVSTVSRWIRAARAPGHTEWLREQAVGWIARFDRDVLAQLIPQPTRLGEALTASAAAAVVLRARVVPRVLPWTVIGQITHGQLVGPPAPG
jgi:Domain of unknown function (DUF6431)/Homeodomain-like domain